MLVCPTPVEPFVLTSTNNLQIVAMDGAHTPNDGLIYATRSVVMTGERKSRTLITLEASFPGHTPIGSGD